MEQPAEIDRHAIRPKIMETHRRLRTICVASRADVGKVLEHLSPWALPTVLRTRMVSTRLCLVLYRAMRCNRSPPQPG
eukprot:9768173-Heterocapsa_arctica.AAC.1